MCTEYNFLQNSFVNSADPDQMAKIRIYTNFHSVWYDESISIKKLHH